MVVYKSLFACALATFSLMAEAFTPEIGNVTIGGENVGEHAEPPPTRNRFTKRRLSYCSKSGTIIDANDDGTIDIVFSQFYAKASGRGQAISICTIDIPIKIPTGYRVGFKSLGVEGTAQFNRHGAAKVTIRRQLNNRRMRKTRRSYYYDYGSTQDIVLTSEGKTPYTRCGEQSANLKARLRLAVRGKNSIIHIDEGAANITYKLDYQRCR
ncbi:DUF4360 domain-containing protein [Zooshikella ganghwensis]|uniref:DUF4360 domain-containing protein n=1 Tax=Zooshikella ganghwensis TaxID=202772 RepID=A0A4P9VL77_9GAMM|nr:DUF4360 domain-containing protein [Zooshikella ganghwensis]RDH44033.1 DUF4360 domain-containing protein [Zooshikella ganghwensis]